MDKYKLIFQLVSEDPFNLISNYFLKIKLAKRSLNHLASFVPGTGFEPAHRNILVN